MKPPRVFGDWLMAEPYGVSMEQCAQIGAQIVDVHGSLSKVLATHGLTEEQWSEVMRHYGGSTEGVNFLCACFAETLVSMRPVVELSVEQWAELVYDLSMCVPADALRWRGLWLGDYARLSEHWDKVLEDDEGLAARFEARLEAIERGEIVTDEHIATVAGRWHLSKLDRAKQGS